MASIFDSYLRKLRETPIDEQTEHTGRAALEALLNEFAAKAGRTKPKVQHEPKHVAAKGAPDFKVSRSGMILGYVETKAIGENLDKILKSDQIARYKTLSQNIILTDYLHFIWINKDGLQRESLCHATDLENSKLRLKDDRVAAVAKLLEGFFSTAPEGIGRAQQLALALATRSKLLRDYLGVELVRQQREHKEGRLYGLFQIFRDQVFHELELKEFADAFAQMLAYGLFLARLNSNSHSITLNNAREYVPGSFRLIRELVDFLAELEKAEYRDVRWVVEEVLSIVNNLNLAAIHEDLSFRRRRAISRKVRAQDEEEHRLFERDPFIYFYEDYLHAYDKQTSKSRGVYYTPPPIVNFIVRAIDDILKDMFGIRSGLADHKRVTVLDFACGTGTFLLEVFQRVFENIGGPDSGKADLIVREHFLKNIYGFEYLIAPYTIAHLKLSQYLQDQKHALKEEERLQVYLTNTLEPIEPQANLLLPAVSAEVAAAQSVKEQPILVVTGNPPYSRHSKNKGAWITAQTAKYKAGFPELSKPAQGKALQDDYVKFIRFAQLKMDAVEEGVVGVITNHSWLDNPTFKGMRKSLMTTFNQIYVPDLHGNSAKKERAPDGSEDENVFDIKQGVAISVFIKGRNIERGVWHGDLWGKRLAKYSAVALGSKSSISWRRLKPGAPDWLLRPQNRTLAASYRAFWSIPTIFSPLGDPAPGIVTTQDQFAISFSAGEARDKVKRLLATSSERDARKLFRLCSQDQWSYATAKEELPKINLSTATVELTYRPFDNRWTIWDRNVAVHRRERVMSHMLQSNLALLTARSNKSPATDHFFLSDKPSETKAAESTVQSYSFPLFAYRESGIRYENLSHEFRDFLDSHYEHHYTPEEILGYIYAVVYTPTYRARYAEFLRIDFPRVPFPKDLKHFETLSGLGWELVQAHLLRAFPRCGNATYYGKGDHVVESVRYSPQEQAIHINKTQCFKPVPLAVWDFHIGGYRVLDKYLKSRRGRALLLDEINHVGAVVDCLAFTIRQMAAIDKAYRAAFPEQA
ncbi:MAG: type ISP restriction/modification enzyme [Dongiaceae bacterium]